MFASNKSAAPSSSKLFVEDVFSTWLYTSTGSNQTINNGIDLAGKGGMVLFKGRSGSGATYGWGVFDTNRGVNKGLRTNDTSASFTDTTSLTSFNSNGFGIGIDNNVYVANAFNGGGSASWTFRKAPKFFDVVTFTANSSGVGTFNHALGSSPGVVILKATGISEAWYVYHRSLANTDGLFLNTTDASTNFGVGANWLTATSTSVTAKALTANQTYVAYLFAHDTTSDGIIQCGSFNQASSATPEEINLGWEPQWLLVKRSNSTSNWMIIDNMRGMVVDNGSGTGDMRLFPNLSNAESGDYIVDPTSTGFKFWGSTGDRWIYIAIRRGPMRTPTSGTSVFSPDAFTSSGSGDTRNYSFSPDLSMLRMDRTQSFINFFSLDRLRGWNAGTISINSTSAEVSSSGRSDGSIKSNSLYLGNTSSGETRILWNFARAPGFFDEVCYTGTGTARTVNHNLGVAPELMIVKARTAPSAGSANWLTYHSALGASAWVALNLSNSVTTGDSGSWNNTSPTSTVFTVGTYSDVNYSNTSYLAYLFATCPGVSKVGSYTGNGTTQTINCGFASGARFVLIKQTDSTGDWYVFDTARGMTTLTDPYLRFNSGSPESATLGAVTTTSVGFSVNASVLAAINTSGANYIFLAVA